MILSDSEIRTALKSGEIMIDPPPNEIGPCSVDLHLSDVFIVFKPGYIVRPSKKEEIYKYTEKIKTNGRPFHLAPNQFILGSTKEKIAVSQNFAATLEGRSSIARLGIVVQAAGLVNPGTGMKKPTTLTLEIYGQANTVITLEPGMPIVQIIFHRLSTPATVGYDERPQSQYVGLTDPSL